MNAVQVEDHQVNDQATLPWRSESEYMCWCDDEVNEIEPTPAHTHEPKREILEPVGTSRRPAQMVWACVWLDERGVARRSKLVMVERDPDAKKRHYSSKSYMEALTKGLLPHYRRSQLFMQDGAGIHRSRAVRSFLDQHHVNTIDWPAYWPDLNPIGHL